MAASSLSISLLSSSLSSMVSSSSFFLQNTTSSDSYLNFLEGAALYGRPLPPNLQRSGTRSSDPFVLRPQSTGKPPNPQSPRSTQAPLVLGSSGVRCAKPSPALLVVYRRKHNVVDIGLDLADHRENYTPHFSHFSAFIFPKKNCDGHPNTLVNLSIGAF